MNIARKMINVLGATSKIFTDEEYGFALHEVHHRHKKDRPSGTALSWVEWLGLEADVSSGRVGDVVGDHKLTLEIPYEQINIQHVASDRKVFAQGALWTAKRVLDGGIEPGLNSLEDIMDKELGL
jgi:4-hydroxy-tetrahydrodipicolinate reductase